MSDHHEFDVGVSTHDLVKSGVLEAEVYHYIISTDYSHHDASLIALQWASAHGMPTQLYERF